MRARELSGPTDTIMDGAGEAEATAGAGPSQLASLVDDLLMSSQPGRPSGGPSSELSSSLEQAASTLDGTQQHFTHQAAPGRQALQERQDRIRSILLDLSPTKYSSRAPGVQQPPNSTGLSPTVVQRSQQQQQQSIMSTPTNVGLPQGYQMQYAISSPQVVGLHHPGPPPPMSPPVFPPDGGPLNFFMQPVYMVGPAGPHPHAATPDRGAAMPWPIDDHLQQWRSADAGQNRSQGSPGGGAVVVAGLTSPGQATELQASGTQVQAKYSRAKRMLQVGAGRQACAPA